MNLQVEIARDQSLPATAFRINGSGVLEEGIELELGHPLTGRTPALFVGSNYLKRDNHSGCIYQVQNGRAVARRAAVKTIPLEGRRPINVLARAQDGNEQFLLHADPHAALPKGISLRAESRFYSGVEHSGMIVEKAFEGEALIALPDGASATVFYTDGRVARVVRNGDTLTPVTLSLFEQGMIRLEHAQANIASSDDVQRCTFWYHQIVTLLEIGGKRSEELFSAVYDVLDEAAARRALTPGVYNRLMLVLRKHRPMMAMCLGNQSAKSKNVDPSTKKKQTAAIAAKKRVRSEASSDIRNKMRGAKGGSGQKTKGKKK